MKKPPSFLPALAALFSETVSKTPRPKGRPRKYDTARHRAFEQKLLDGRPRHPRSVQNYHCQVRALNVINDRQTIEEDSRKELLAYFSKRQTLLAAIGRIEDDDLLIKAAVTVASFQLRGEKARAEIRKIRGHKWADWSLLCRNLHKLLAGHRQLYPTQPRENFVADVQTAIEHVLKFDLKHIK
jgi:hypothetical protein